MWPRCPQQSLPQGGTPAILCSPSQPFFQGQGRKAGHLQCAFPIQDAGRGDDYPPPQALFSVQSPSLFVYTAEQSWHPWGLARGPTTEPWDRASQSARPLRGSSGSPVTKNGMGTQGLLSTEEVFLLFPQRASRLLPNALPEDDTADILQRLLCSLHHSVNRKGNLFRAKLTPWKTEAGRSR